MSWIAATGQLGTDQLMTASTYHVTAPQCAYKSQPQRHQEAAETATGSSLLRSWCVRDKLTALHFIHASRTAATVAPWCSGCDSLCRSGIVAAGVRAFDPAVSHLDLRRPPLVRLEMISPGHREVQRTLVGLYVDERVCYLESEELGSTALRFAAGSAIPLPEQELWAESVAEVIRKLPETQPSWVIGHAEPIEAQAPALATALSERRAEAARALLIAHGLKSERLQVLARGSDESALLRGELHKAVQWRRATVQIADKPSNLGARLIQVRGDQRPDSPDFHSQVGI